MAERATKLDCSEWDDIAERLFKGASSKKQTQRSGTYQHTLKRVHSNDKAKRFIEAAEAFRISGKLVNASDAYCRAASILEHQLESQNPAALLYREAGLCLEKIEPTQGSDNLGKAASLYCEMEEFSQAGRIRQVKAENYESSGHLTLAIENYIAASKFFMVDTMMMPALSCLRHAAALLYKRREYLPAAELYADIGQKEWGHNLTKHQARESFFMFGLLLLAQGSRGNFSMIKERLKAFAEADDSFRDSPQNDFLQTMMMIIESGDKHNFSSHIYAYCSVHDVDVLTVNIMKDILEHMKAL